MPERSLLTLLSQAVVAFTIEVDNQFEERMPNRTTAPRSRRDRAADRKGPWLVSLPMWMNFLRYVDASGTPAGEVQRRAGVIPQNFHTILYGMHRWGYVTVDGASSDGRTRSYSGDAVIGLAGNGDRAGDLWAELLPGTEQRWKQRFGGAAVEELGRQLHAVAGGLRRDLPAYLPVLRYGLRAEVPRRGRRVDADDWVSDSLVSLLSRVLLVFSLEFEDGFPVSLPCVADGLRAIGDGCHLRDVPDRAGVSKEAVDMITGVLEKQGRVAIASGQGGSRLRTVSPTPKGKQALEEAEARLAALEQRWVDEHDSGGLVHALGRIVGDAAALSDGLRPPEGGWRPSAPARLPDYPVVLHRGGFPDGS